MPFAFRQLTLLSLTTILFAGCAPAFRGAVINGTAATLDDVEFAHPNGKRLLFQDMEPYHVKSFAGSFPNGDVRLFWKEGAEAGGKTYGVTLPAARVKEALGGDRHVLLMRIEHDKEPHVLVAGVRDRDLGKSLLQRRGDAYPAHLIER
jgi:hypothetical protein